MNKVKDNKKNIMILVISGMVLCFIFLIGLYAGVIFANNYNEYNSLLPKVEALGIEGYKEGNYLVKTSTIEKMQFDINKAEKEKEEQDKQQEEVTKDTADNKEEKNSKAKESESKTENEVELNPITNDTSSNDSSTDNSTVSKSNDNVAESSTNSSNKSSSNNSSTNNSNGDSSFPDNPGNGQVALKADYDMGEEIYELINQHRTSMGLNKLSYNWDNQYCAEQEAITFYETGNPHPALCESPLPDGSVLKGGNAGIDSGAGDWEAEDFVNGWINSSSHEKIQTMDEWNSMSVSVIKTSKHTIYTEVYFWA